MKKFRYRLERVLEHRRSIRRDKQIVLIRAQSQLNDLIEEYNQLEEALSRAQLDEGIITTVEAIQTRGEYGARLRAEMETKKTSIAEAEIAVEEARVEFQEAAKEAEALEKLKERKATEYKRYHEQEELKLLDEMTVMRIPLTAKEKI